MTTATLLTDLYNITVTGATKRQMFQLPPDEEFLDFTDFPLYVVESGNEEDEPVMNRESTVTFYPAVHFFIEDASASDMETWRDTIRNGIMNNATLRADCLDAPQVTEITVSLSETRKLMHMKFQLKLTFYNTHT